MHAFLESRPEWESDYKAPVYYKGLAAHEKDEVKKMFKPEKFNSSLYLFTLADSDKELFELYFDDKAGGAAGRRAVLSSPVQYLTFEEAQALHRSRLIPCSTHLNVDTKAFKLCAIERQIPHCVDGLVPSMRKIAAGCRVILGAGKKDKKIFQVGGEVASLMLYHHGDKSLNDTMKRMAQCYPGAKQYPLLVGHGEFGSRHMAGKDAGEARYIGVSLSPLMKAVFPDADMPLLPYTFEEGQRAEPRYFVPVVPLAVLERGGSRPSEGWAHESFARDYASVMKVLDALLSDSSRGRILRAAADELHAQGATSETVQKIRDLEGIGPLPISTRDFVGTIRPYNGSMHSFGVYDYDEKKRTIRVTELPIGVPTGGDEKKCPGYIAKLSKGIRAELIESFDDNSGDDNVDLAIKLKPGAYERIQAEFGGDFIGPIENFLQLYESVASNLNYVGVQGTVLEFGQSYLAALLYWFPVRRDLYQTRLNREAVLLELRILELENIIRYSQLYDELGLKALDDEAATALLAEREFPLLDSGLLHSPGFTVVDELRQLIVEGPKISHNYLLDLTDRSKLAPRVAKKQADLGKLRDELKTYQAALDEKPFPGISVWRREIAEFAAQVERGIATRWLFRKSRDEDDAENGEE